MIVSRANGAEDTSPGQRPGYRASSRHPPCRGGGSLRPCRALYVPFGFRHPGRCPGLASAGAFSAGRCGVGSLCEKSLHEYFRDSYLRVFMTWLGSVDIPGSAAGFAVARVFRRWAFLHPWRKPSPLKRRATTPARQRAHPTGCAANASAATQGSRAQTRGWRSHWHGNRDWVARVSQSRRESAPKSLRSESIPAR